MSSNLIDLDTQVRRFEIAEEVIRLIDMFYKVFPTEFNSTSAPYARRYYKGDRIKISMRTGSGDEHYTTKLYEIEWLACDVYEVYFSAEKIERPTDDADQPMVTSMFYKDGAWLNELEDLARKAIKAYQDVGIGTGDREG